MGTVYVYSIPNFQRQVYGYVKASNMRE